MHSSSLPFTESFSRFHLSAFYQDKFPSLILYLLIHSGCIGNAVSFLKLFCIQLLSHFILLHGRNPYLIFHKDKRIRNPIKKKKKILSKFLISLKRCEEKMMTMAKYTKKFLPSWTRSMFSKDVKYDFIYTDFWLSIWAFSIQPK